MWWEFWKKCVEFGELPWPVEPLRRSNAVWNWSRKSSSRRSIVSSEIPTGSLEFRICWMSTKIRSYIVKDLWRGGMVDRGSCRTSSHRDSERTDVRSNMVVDKHEFPFSSLRMISALVAKITVIVLSTPATSWGWGETWEKTELSSGRGPRDDIAGGPKWDEDESIVLSGFYANYSWSCM
jgi:hypothetical protein